MNLHIFALANTYIRMYIHYKLKNIVCVCVCAYSINLTIIIHFIYISLSLLIYALNLYVCVCAYIHTFVRQKYLCLFAFNLEFNS